MDKGDKIRKVSARKHRIGYKGGWAGLADSRVLLSHVTGPHPCYGPRPSAYQANFKMSEHRVPQDRVSPATPYENLLRTSQD